MAKGRGRVRWTKELPVLAFGKFESVFRGWLLNDAGGTWDMSI